MGGYCGKAVALINESSEESCFDVYVWHDGQWAFGDDQEPAEMHHCDPDQFIEFGRTVKRFQKGDEE